MTGSASLICDMASKCRTRGSLVGGQRMVICRANLLIPCCGGSLPRLTNAPDKKPHLEVRIYSIMTFGRVKGAKKLNLFTPIA